MPKRKPKNQSCTVLLTILMCGRYKTEERDL